MKIISIEPTPSPNSMKLNLDEALPSGVNYTYTKKHPQNMPEFARKLLAIEGVTSVFHAAGFIALDRHPKFDSYHSLTETREIFGEEAGTQGSGPLLAVQDAFGEAKVRLQHFRGIPMQLRVSTGLEERRSASPERFAQAALEATAYKSKFD